MTATETPEPYGVGARAAGAEIAAPELPYRPRDPRRTRPAIALIGCGGVAEHHLRAYRTAGYRVVALVDPVRERATARRDEFYPGAAVFANHAALFASDLRVEVVDVATHPEGRETIVADVLRAGKHVLSQKPFVLDLAAGERLVELAARGGRRLAVNQNGRWAPHFAWMREAVRAGLVGEVAAVDAVVHWNHEWVAGTRFDATPDLILFDFAVHWFDFLATVIARPARRVMAAVARAPGQRARPPLLGHALVEYDGARAVLAFHGASRHLQRDTTIVAGSAGSLVASGPDLLTQSVTLHRAAGLSRPVLEGSWFVDGFHGAMGELLCAIEEDREPTHSARDNLRTLALAFAAVASSRSGEPCGPGEVRGIA
ncbi:MAG: Gfo/Idh/MocA family oxidoreductase [Planctomycetota bacterium]